MKPGVDIAVFEAGAIEIDTKAGRAVTSWERHVEERHPVCRNGTVSGSKRAVSERKTGVDVEQTGVAVVKGGRSWTAARLGNATCCHAVYDFGCGFWLSLLVRFHCQFLLSSSCFSSFTLHKMPPRGNERLDFTPILTHYLFLFTSILAVVGWFVAFIAQCVVNADLGNTEVTVGVLWFAIFLQLFLIIGVLYTLASDSVAMHRVQISTFGAIAIVFAVQGVNQSIYTGKPSQGALAAGWLILAVVDILWVLYFTSEEDSLAFHIFNSLGTGGLTPPSRRRRTRTTSVHNMGSGNGYGGVYSPAAGIGPGTYDTKLNNTSFSPSGPVRSQNSFNAASLETGTPKNTTVNMPTSPPSPGPGASQLPADTSNAGIGSPLMTTPGNAGVGAGGGGLPLPADTSATSENYPYRAKALYAYTASVDDPNEISFAKGELLDIVDKQGKWWQARKEDGTIGIAPSNYLQII